ncbi:MAG: AraC family transcriptional regulator [Oscillospiraceae bacterium]|nr:AraC family transcriptional regulator [Oscillospiraceae bacterium]
MEHIISFGESFLDENTPFSIEMTGITYPDPKYHIVRGSSHIHCFEYVISGEGEVTVNGSTVYPRRGDVYILPKGADHDYRALPDDPFEKIWFNVSGPLCDELIHIYGITGVLLVKELDAYPIFGEFLNICENKELPDEEVFALCSPVFHKLLIKISERLRSRGEFNISETARKIKSFIDHNIFERLSVRRISAHVNLSPPQASRVFKQSYGTSIYDYVLSRKIETAKLLLRNTSLTIKEIAYKLNFADEHYFSNVFLQKTGVRPKKF